MARLGLSKAAGLGSARKPSPRATAAHPRRRDTTCHLTDRNSAARPARLQTTDVQAFRPRTPTGTEASEDERCSGRLLRS